MTQKDLAKLAGCSQATMCRYINATQRPENYARAEQLAKIFGTTPELWLKGSSSEIRAALDAFDERTEQAVSDGQGAQTEAA